MSESAYAEDVNYWKSGDSSPETWIQKIRKELESVGGIWLSYFFGSDSDGKAAFRIEFELDGETFRILWPVLRSKNGEEFPAHRQAATALYHTIKAKCVELKFCGARQTFYQHLVLEDGRTAGQLLPHEAVDQMPKLITHNTN